MNKPSPVDKLRGRYQDLFISGSLGRWVLGNIMNGPCRMFQMCLDDETRIRQNVGREILDVCGLLDGSQNPQTIIAKLASKVEPESITLRQFIRIKLNLMKRKR